MIPGDPARVMAGTDADAAGLEEIREKYGLKDPVPVQYLRWVGLALRGDLGESIRTRASVTGTVAKKLPITIQLAAFAILIAVGIAIPAGVLAAVRRNTFWDLLASGVSLCGVSVPNFWLGIMLILFFSVRLGWLPASGFVPLWESPLANLQRMLMPSFVLGTALAAVLMRQIRNSMIEVLSADYIRTARAKGLPGRAVVFRHAIRNGLIPVVTILGLQMGALMGGAVVTEQIFVVPGGGRRRRWEASSSCPSRRWPWGRRGSRRTTRSAPTGARSARLQPGRIRSGPMTWAVTTSRGSFGGAASRCKRESFRSSSPSRSA